MASPPVQAFDENGEFKAIPSRMRAILLKKMCVLASLQQRGRVVRWTRIFIPPPGGEGCQLVA
jgi:hypothetical protein